MAEVIGFHKKRIGGKIGYDQSLITAITQRLDDAIAYENSLKQKTPQKSLRQPKMGDYYTYNGERDNVDYEWEKNESMNLSRDIIRKAIMESIGGLIDEARFKPTYYSMNDKLELGEDPYARLDKKDQSGRKKNFSIMRNGEEYWVSRSSTVSLYVFCKDSSGKWNVLVSQRGENTKWGGKWNVVAGFLDYGETLEQAAARECFEECGVNIEGAKLINCGANSEKLEGSVNHKFACILDGVIDQYPPSMKNCEGYGTEAQEVQNVSWVPVAAVGKLNMARSQKKNAKDLINRLAHDVNGNSASFNELLGKLHDMVVSRELDQVKYQEIINILKS